MERSTPLFIKTFDFVTWLLNTSQGFPRNQRFVVTRRIQDATLNFQERLVEANRSMGRERLRLIHLADIELDKARLYLRLSFRWKWLSEGQYNHAARQLTEIGKLLGAWKKNLSNTLPARKK